MTASSPRSDEDLESSSSAVSEPSSLNDHKDLVFAPPPHHPHHHQQQQHRGAPGGSRGRLTGKRGVSARGQHSLTTGGELAQLAPGQTVQYQTSNGILSVLPLNLAGNGNVMAVPSGSVDMSSLAAGTTVIMTQDGQQFLIPVSLGGDSSLSTGSMKSVASGSSGSSAGSPSLSGPNLTPQQQVMAEEAGRKREVRLLKNREAAKECRRKKKEYIKCLENRVAVLENQNKALIDELKSLKELYCKSTSHD
ncbi:cyclic AMP-responsive element-binding protein 1-like isoform X2 [Paramacrobiotus metropolitanus]|uniref:cyclic AMP-responsive element-binding protein 1-like isoform X2 n=1 Tax=Paramacrobiotus metropolitanus TaxID=2943436 RepID=UPI002445F445|nr:cyclic AMP-responsive element-binding protein 1-like isoform X2 [Paramacrobiotus metropolitanus]